MEHRKQVQQAKINELNHTYEAVAWAWLEYRQTKKHFSENYKKDVISLIKHCLLPHFANIPIAQITAPMALKAFKQYQDAGAREKEKKHLLFL